VKYRYVLFLCAQVLAGNKNAILTLSKAALGTNKYYLVYMAPMPYNYSSLKVNFTLALLLIGEVSWIEGPPSELLVLRESQRGTRALFHILFVVGIRAAGRASGTSATRLHNVVGEGRGSSAGAVSIHNAHAKVL
jgi:hypothetical protein